MSIKSVAATFDIYSTTVPIEAARLDCDPA